MTGPIGKLCRIAESLPVDVYEKIDEPNVEGIREIPDEILQELSTDQFYLCQIVKSITSGSLIPGIENSKPGPLNHSRWLTLANR